MKTCPNPSCGTTGLPDDAKFCPVCGFDFVKYAKQRREQMKLLKMRQEWESFKDERENELRILEPRLKELRNELQKANRGSDSLWMRYRYYIILLVLGGLIILLGVVWGWNEASGWRAALFAFLVLSWIFIFVFGPRRKDIEPVVEYPQRLLFFIGMHPDFYSKLECTKNAEKSQIANMEINNPAVITDEINSQLAKIGEQIKFTERVDN